LTAEEGKRERERGKKKREKRREIEKEEALYGCAFVQILQHRLPPASLFLKGQCTNIQFKNEWPSRLSWLLARYEGFNAF
jgi:hypothetical protein